MFFKIIQKIWPQNYIQRLSQNTVEFLDTRSLHYLPEFSDSRPRREFQDE